MDSITDEIQDLRNQLESKNNEIKSNNKRIEKLLRENEISVKYNNQLRDELKLLSAKLHLHQNVIKTIKSSIETQTDLSLISEPFTGKENTICSNCRKSLKLCDKSNDSKDWKQNCTTNKTISDLVRETAEEVVQKNDFENDYLYDEKSKTYYSRSSGWYYYPESYLFYDPKTQNYYKYDSETKEYNFHSSLKDMTHKREKLSKNFKSKKQKITKEIENLENNEKDVESIVVSSEEEGEIGDSDEISLISDDSISSDLNYDEKRELSPPMVRMIVKKSLTLEIGSLLLVTCMGAKIGNDSNCDLYITDESVSRSHAEIRYDYNTNNYMIKDLNSTNGTFTNGTKINKNCETILKHCDELSFGKCLLLVHIHNGKDVTCDNCEPGIVIASLKSNAVQNNIYSKTDKEIDRKKQLKSLKKRYGLKDADFVEPKSIQITRTNYKDRAEQRRVHKGSDNPYEKTAAGTSLDTALSKSNKGFQMLSKMGWTSGQALGRHEDGIVEPINVINPDLQSQPSTQTEC